jgi:tRNA modification GTPase
MTQRPTIAAVQTPPGRGGIAVLHLAGPRTDAVLQHVFRPWRARRGAGPPARRRGVLRLGHLVDGQRVIDEAVVARSGQRAEVNLHGGPAAARAALRLFGRLGATVVPAPAAAVESFPLDHPRHDNGAVGAELLHALPDALSPRVLAALTRQWSDGVSALARRAVAACEAPGSCPPAAAAELARALRAAARRLPTMQRLLRPAEVVLAGPPNAGKSALANALVGRPVSLVHDEAGTTRDWVRELALLDGVPVWLTDTAGLWRRCRGIEAEAVRRARARIRTADLVVLGGAGRRTPAPRWLAQRAVLHVSTKCDLCRPFPGAAAGVSAVTGAGLRDLAGAVLRALGLSDLDPAAAAAFTERQAGLLARAADAIDAAAGRAARAALRQLLRGGREAAGYEAT